MSFVTVTAWDLAARFVGVQEIPGKEDNPAILAMLRLDQEWPKGDEVPWCSAFVNYIAWLLRLPRSKSLRARSWLRVGVPAIAADVTRGADVVILSRGRYRPGPDVIAAPGHVGFFTKFERVNNTLKYVHLLGGNQQNTVGVKRYPVSRVLGYRHLAV